jgi:uncharacterized protein
LLPTEELTMITRATAPTGSPCWADLWTSDVEGGRAFYTALFGWGIEDPDPQYGGYFNFTRAGVRIAGCMGDMGDMKADNTWKIYLATDDMAKTVELAEAQGAEIVSPPVAVGDLGIQAVLHDPTGAHLGAWQRRSFPGFTVLNEAGAPSWFELHSRDYDRAVDFYRSVFRWETDVIGDGHEIRYTAMRDPSGSGELAGILDASGFLPEGVPSRWCVYFEVEDADATVAQVKSLGGSLVAAPESTPYGRLATVADPVGAEFKLRTPNP